MPSASSSSRCPLAGMVELAAVQRPFARLDEEARRRDDDPGAGTSKEPREPGGRRAGDDAWPVHARVERRGLDALETVLVQLRERLVQEHADPMPVRRPADDEQPDAAKRLRAVLHVGDGREACRDRLLEHERDRLGHVLGVAEPRFVEHQCVHGASLRPEARPPIRRNP